MQLKRKTNSKPRNIGIYSWQLAILQYILEKNIINCENLFRIYIISIIKLTFGIMYVKYEFESNFSIKKRESLMKMKDRAE